MMNRRTAATGEGDGQGEDEPQSALHALLSRGRWPGRRTAQGARRDFLKRHRFELSAVGGFYASDALSSTYSYGGALAYYPSEDFGVEMLVTRSPVNFRLEEPFNAFDHELHFPPGVAWQGIFSMLWSPVHAKFRFTEETIIHGDLFVVAGAGKTFHDSVLGLTWEAGAGFSSTSPATSRSVRPARLPLPQVLGRGRITNNVTILAGPAHGFG
jgi:outer membrane beta-barrel protein